MTTTDIVPFEKYAIATADIGDIVETIKDNLDSQPIDEFVLDRVGMPSGGSTTWTVPTVEGDVDTKVITGIVVFTKMTRAYWIKSYEEGDGNDLPDCSSIDAKIARPNGEFKPPAPRVSADANQFACANCEFAQFGSRKDGDGQACQQRRQLFILQPGDVLPMVVSLSPTSLKAASDYMMRLTRAGKPYWKVFTSITLEKHTDPKPHARAIFTTAGELSADEIGTIKAYRDDLVPAFSNVTVDPMPQASGDVD